MRAWTCTTFEGHYHVGCAAVVVAETEAVALHWLVDELKSHGLSGLRSDGATLDNTDLKPLPIAGGRKVRVLCGGVQSP